MTKWWMLSPALVVVTACSVDPVDLRGKSCPCDDGFVCDPVENVCVTTLDASVGGSSGTAGAGGTGALGGDGGRASVLGHHVRRGGDCVGRLP